MLRIWPLIYIEKWCLIAVINMVNYIVDFYTLFILLLFWWININSSFIFNLFQSWLNMWYTDYKMAFSISVLVLSLGYRLGLIWESLDDTRDDMEKDML
jgi:hypothetical protein